ncbi:MAG: glycosyltransferase family 2 protein [Deltaproteobacteria bacterium]|nr:glycosyltransferase family 2 protein [Deltaproteobacteria bacterium]
MECELTVVLPAYNEAGNIGEVVAETERVLGEQQIDYEIRVVDDGSTDGTALVLDALQRNNARVSICTHPLNRGYGAAVKSGLRGARGTHVLVSDGDGQFSMKGFDSLWKARREADLVLGFRLARRDPVHRRAAGWIYSRLVAPLLFGLRVRDVNCGYKLFSRAAIDGLEPGADGALVYAELLARALKRGASLTEIGVEHLPRGSGTSTGLKPSVVFRALRELSRVRAAINREGLATGGSFTAPVRDGEALLGDRAGLRPGGDALQSPPS